MKFNEKLLRLREKNNLSQEELAEKLNVTRQTISKWEIGNCYTDMGKLSEMCKIFNCKLSDLLDDGVLPNNKNNDINKTIIIIILVLLILIASMAIGYLSFKVYKMSKYEESMSIFYSSLDRYGMYEGKKKIGSDVIELIEKVNDNNIFLKSNNIDSFREKEDWCVYIYSMSKDLEHEEIKFYVYSDDPTNYPYTKYDSSVIDPSKYYKVTMDWNHYHLDWPAEFYIDGTPKARIQRITQINITEVVDI